MSILEGSHCRSYLSNHHLIITVTISVHLHIRNLVGSCFFLCPFCKARGELAGGNWVQSVGGFREHKSCAAEADVWEDGGELASGRCRESWCLGDVGELASGRCRESWCLGDVGELASGR